MSELNKKKLGAIASFWQQAKTASFIGIGNLRIAYVYIIKDPELPTLVISSGRSESYLKYQELAYDLSAMGFNIFIPDHRGQGISQRILGNTHKGYVEHFDYYADDLATFITNEVQPIISNKSLSILAHSMGSAIALRMLQRHSVSITSAILASPMIAINFGKTPYWLAKTIIQLGNCINRMATVEPWYFPGHKNYQPALFTDNPLMGCSARFERFINLYQQESTLQLGGVTFHWLAQALQANKNIFRQLSQIKTPLFILQAANDVIVDNRAQNTFCQRLHHLYPQLCAHNPKVFDEARHELLFEQEYIREEVLTYIHQCLTTTETGS
ncbi:alpha/beta fold hydrolase [Thalassotalea sp. 1_MG-2023]|uniref:alpha/beta fold hydrolase n=1 Tax=Thalassotalea sp. 1_MG-2023 TaxID=3062680 RepID=UPI0026E273E7|nr:alpha/beta fold hydrolase [Thalassotalea sp. 1_MG-2023]MDO6425605.1 alpha/beta fold hydrolase [Thalassotalea sp. 1_MG-2023]